MVAPEEQQGAVGGWGGARPLREEGPNNAVHARVVRPDEGEREQYVLGCYGQHLDPTAYNYSAVPWKLPLVISDALSYPSGVRSHYVYNWSLDTHEWSSIYGLPYDGDLSQYTPDTPPGDYFVRGEGKAVLKRIRPPMPWYSSDMNPYVFTTLDVAYAPPPPPHPWSGYKQIWIQTYFLFHTWGDTITAYAQQSKDTTVVIYDQTTNIVYASTTGAKIINNECWSANIQGETNFDINDCAVLVVNMSKVIWAAWRSAAGSRAKRGPSVFWKATLDGTPHFLRHTQLFTFTPAGGTPNLDAAILWFATTASVQKEVFAALTVFIIFACTVFVFDLGMALFEIYLVAIPLTKIAKSLDNLYTFEPELVLDMLKDVTVAACLTVKEVHEVAKGLEVACRALMEYKALLPTTLFATVDSSSDSAHEVQTNALSVASCSPEDSDGSGGGVKVLPTSVSLSHVKGTFVKVCFLEGQLPTSDVLTGITELVERAANNTKGTVLISPCEPGTFYVSWNISRKVVEGPRKAALFVDSVLKNKNPQVCLSAGMAHGTAAAGNIGSRSLRGFVIHGSILMNLHAAQVYASRLQGTVGTPVVVMNSKLGELLIGVFATLAVGVLKVGHDKPDVMLCLKSSIEHVTQEWMYQLQQARGDVLLGYFKTIARGEVGELPQVDVEKLCQEQRVALERARGGELVSCYVRDGMFKDETVLDNM